MILRELLVSAEEARALRDAATPGPWEYDGDWSVWVNGREERDPCSVSHTDVAIVHLPGDAKLVQKAPNLALTVEHLSRECDRQSEVRRAAESRASRAASIIAEKGDEIAALQFRLNDARTTVEKTVRLELCEVLDRLGADGLSHAIEINKGAEVPTVRELHQAITTHVQALMARARAEASR